MLFYAHTHTIRHHQSRLKEHKHTTIKVSPYTQSIHSHKWETLVHKARLLKLLLPRSAHITPPHSLTQALQQNDTAPLLGKASKQHRTQVLSLPFSQTPDSVGTS